MLMHKYLLKGFTIDDKQVLNNFLEVQGTFEMVTSATMLSPPLFSSISTFIQSTASPISQWWISSWLNIVMTGVTNNAYVEY